MFTSPSWGISTKPLATAWSNNPDGLGRLSMSGGGGGQQHAVSRSFLSAATFHPLFDGA